ncbi:fructose-bisphosphatase class III [Salmonella enterica]|uniref:fructose-bisphosphatase class III n=1 Tax=Salmonella enterica TaxID=28901 RepID=UPI0040464820
MVSDVHGEFQKLEHVLRNGSGSLRPLVERTFGDRLDEAGRTTLLNLVYYPRETWQRVSAKLPDAAMRATFVRETIVRELELLRRALSEDRAFCFICSLPDGGSALSGLQGRADPPSI